VNDELNPRMTERRLLLGLGVSATVLLPSWLRPAIAWAATRHHHHHRRLLETPATTAHAAPLIMLDPGHGGKDPGAIGVAGTYEKHIALAAAHDLRRRLEASGRYRVAMTRATDRFIPLEDRVAIAQDQGAELFVSMHADSVTDHQVRGASVYTLSTTASDRQTAALAISENSADRFGGPGFTGVSPEVARILASLVGRETRVDSAPRCCRALPAMRLSRCCNRPRYRACWSRWASCPTSRTRRNCGSRRIATALRSPWPMRSMPGIWPGNPRVWPGRPPTD
jgi:N-acetylmuramoyl-L-alanine amidase